MASNSKQKKTSTLSRDLLNLALLLAFLHVDPEAYLGFNMNNYYQPPSPHKILDDLSSLGRFNGYIPSPRSLEISAYILNAETDNPNPSNIFSAVNNNENSEQSQNYDSGVSDVDSGHHSSDEEGLASASASPEHNEDIDWLFGKVDENDEVFSAATEIKSEVFESDPVTSTTSARSYTGMFDSDESSNIFKDLDEILIKQEETEGEPTIKQEEIDFAPDEEDVENQLMHIDDQLIRLDENIEDISGHLDEQLLNTVASSTSGEELLTQEQQNFLFGAMPEVMDPMHSWSFPLVSDPDEAEIDQLFNTGLPSPLMPLSPFLSEKQEEDVPKNSETNTGEPIKQEKPDNTEEETQLYDDDEMDWFEPLLQTTAPLSPSSESLASTSLPQDLLNDPEETASHLQDHNYALSPYDECFGESSKATYPAEFLEGATAMLSPASSVSTGFYNSQRETRDERKARELNLPFSVWDIIDLPIDGYNELLSRHTLTEAQMSLCKDIRRRGKNKVAAQNCRKRKMDLISQLEEEVSKARHHKQVLLAEREELYRLRSEWSSKLMNLEASVLRGLNKNTDVFSLDYSGPSVKVTTRLAKAKA